METLLGTVDELVQQAKWQKYFSDFAQPYYFYAPADYESWLPKAGFCPERVELIPKVMQHQGRAGLTGWLRTTWMPYTGRVPVDMREELLDDMVTAYLRAYPLDDQGMASVGMMRLEVEAFKVEASSRGKHG